MDKDQIIKELEALAQQARENKRHSESREMSARYQGEAFAYSQAILLLRRLS